MLGRCVWMEMRIITSLPVSPDGVNGSWNEGELMSDAKRVTVWQCRRQRVDGTELDALRRVHPLERPKAF